MRRIATLLLAAMLCGCALAPPGFSSQPTPTALPDILFSPSPTPLPLTGTLRLDEAGLELSYPSGWATRVVSNSITLAPNQSALDSTSPGADMVLAIDITPLDALSAQFGAEAAQSPESFFAVSGSAAEGAGYSLGATAPITVAGQPGLAADLTAAGGAGRLSVILAPAAAVRALGQAAPGAWADQGSTYEAIVASLTFFAPPEPTPAPRDLAEQPELLDDGPSGFVLRLGGSSGPPASRFVSARGMAVAPNGTLYLAESSRGVWVFDPDGTLQATFGGDELLDAYDIARAPDGGLFVADYGRNAVVRFRADGSFVERWGSAGDEPGQFGLSSPQRIASGPDGSIYALDTRPGPESGRVVSSVMRFSEDGRLLGRIELPADLAPADLAVDEAGAIYLAESFGGSVVKLGADGSELARFGDPANPQRYAAGAIDLDPDGNIYLATYASGVLRLSPSGIVTASGGGTVAPGSMPGPGEFSLPNGVAAGPGGVVWVSDNSGEYSAVSALRLQADAAAAATAQAALPQATAAPSPAPEQLVRQWASEATASSFYAPDYEPAGATGAPDVATCQDSPDAWASADPNGLETLELGFRTPIFAVGVTIHQSYNPGFVSKVELIDERGEASTVYTATPAPGGVCPGALEVGFEQTLTRVVAVRLTVDQRSGANWAEIDAVELIGVP
jgi:DNA-binding beta-propeller fold protein YncE